MLEKMSDFFEARLQGYDEHMLKNIDSAEEFYPYTADLLPKEQGARVIDLGCGTGLELREYYRQNPSAKVLGIDLSEGMLSALTEKLPGKDMTLVCGSYFDLPFGIEEFDSAISVESLHHYTKEEKIPLYKKLHSALRLGGYFILTDYFALSDEEEKMHRKNLLQMMAEEGISDGEIYHYDTPLTVEHEIEALTEAGFTAVQVLKSWGATYTLKALK